MDRRSAVIVLVVVQVALLAGIIALAIRGVLLDERVSGLERQLDQLYQFDGGHPPPPGSGPSMVDAEGNLVAEAPGRGGPGQGGRRPGPPPGLDGTALGGEGGRRPDGGPPVDIEDPEAIGMIEQIVEDMWDQQADERAARREEYMEARLETELAAFGQDYDLDDETLAEATRLLSTAAADHLDLHEQLMQGEVEFAEAEQRRQKMRQETERGLEELVGAEGVEELKRRIRMPGEAPKEQTGP